VGSTPHDFFENLDWPHCDSGQIALRISAANAASAGISLFCVALYLWGVEDSVFLRPRPKPQLSTSPARTRFAPWRKGLLTTGGHG
jgi:hypothetical protein